MTRNLCVTAEVRDFFTFVSLVILFRRMALFCLRSDSVASPFSLATTSCDVSLRLAFTLCWWASKVPSHWVPSSFRHLINSSSLAAPILSLYGTIGTGGPGSFPLLVTALHLQKPKKKQRLLNRALSASYCWLAFRYNNVRSPVSNSFFLLQAKVSGT